MGVKIENGLKAMINTFSNGVNFQQLPSDINFVTIYLIRKVNNNTT